MEQYISVDEFARLTGKSATYIRRLCRENKIPFIQEQLQNSTTLKYMIDITAPEAQKHLNHKDNIPEPTEQGSTPSSSRGDDLILELMNEIKELSKEAGKVEQIEDIRKREENNAQFWQNKYFEFQNQVTELNKKVVELEYEKKYLEAENNNLKDQLKQKSFFDIFKKK